MVTVEDQSNRDLALSLSKGGRVLQACFDKLSTGLLGLEGEGGLVSDAGQCFGSTVLAVARRL